MVILYPFCKKWDRDTKDQYILHIVSNDLQLEQILPLKRGNGLLSLSSKEIDIVSMEP